VPRFLDLFPNAASAYFSLNPYGNSDLETWLVYRVEDEAEQAFTFSQIKNGEHTAWVNQGGGVQHGLLKRFYDVSGNSRDVFQNTPENMPTVVFSGVGVTMSNGVPAIAFGVDPMSVNDNCWLDGVGSGILDGGNYTVVDDIGSLTVVEINPQTFSNNSSVWVQNSGNQTYISAGSRSARIELSANDLSGPYAGIGASMVGSLQRLTPTLYSGFIDTVLRNERLFENLTNGTNNGGNYLQRTTATELTIGRRRDAAASDFSPYSGKISSVVFYKTDSRFSEREQMANQIIKDYEILP
jgi:hypothetical protein